MEIPRYAQTPRESGGGPPAIYIERPSRFEPGRPSMHSSGFSPSSVPMPIPSNHHTAEDVAPPPLPPPKFLPGMAPPPLDTKHERGQSFDSNGSWDSPRQELDRSRLGFGREAGQHGAPRFPHKDEGYSSLNSTISFGYALLQKGSWLSIVVSLACAKILYSQVSRFTTETAFHVA